MGKNRLLAKFDPFLVFRQGNYKYRGFDFDA